MRYRDVENLVKRMVLSAPKASLHRFAVQTIQLLRQSAADAIDKELNARERQLILSVLVGLEGRPARDLKRDLDELSESMSADEIRAIEFRLDLIELASALDSFVQYLEDGDPDAIFRIAINGINLVDWQIDSKNADAADYSIDNMLGSPLMVAEIERQRKLLED